MGSQKVKEKRVGVSRSGPQHRVHVDPAVAEGTRRESQRLRQAKCRSLKRQREEADRATHGEVEVPDFMENRDVRAVALQISRAIEAGLACCPGPQMRKEVLGRVLDKHRADLPEHVLPLRTVVAQREIISGVSRCLGEIKQANSGAKLAAKHAILTAAVSGGSISSVREVAKALSVHPRNIMLAMERRGAMDVEGNFLWTLTIRRTRTDGVGEAVKEVVIMWWIQETRVSPNRKQVARRRIAAGVYDEKPLHFLMEPQTSFYFRFKARNPDVLIGERLFAALKPFFVKRMSERNTCCCIYHVELNELLLALNKMRAGGKVCTHEDGTGCAASNTVYKGLTELWQSIVCSKGEFQEWHDLQCLLGTCGDCGLKLLPVCNDELDNADGVLIEWRRFALEQTTSKKGKVSKKLTLVYKKTFPDVLLEYMRPKLQYFVKHNFVAKWQDLQFKACIKTFPINSVVSVVDFAENYTFEIQNEVQSMHWHSYQVSILVHISFRHNPEMDPYNEDTWILNEYHFYISDDKQHDSAFVQHCFGLHWNHMESNGYAPQTHVVWSDGCAAQFKSSKPWYFVSRYPNMTGGCKMLWNFFGSGHGKGPHDGAGAVVKSFIRREQLNPDGRRLQCAQDVVDLLAEKLSYRPESSYSGKRKPLRRFFWHIPEGSVDRTSVHACDIIPGCREYHSIMAVNKNCMTNLMIKKLSCFCVFCLDSTWSECENMSWTGEWEPRYLQPENTSFIRDCLASGGDDMWGNYQDDAELLAATVDIGDNFALNAAKGNSEGCDYWIINCTKALHSVKVAFQCKWGEEFEVGDEALAGIYYQRWGNADSSYVLLKNSHTVFVHARYVRAVKFAMLPKDYRVQGNDLVYELPAHASAGIKERIAALDFEDD